MKQVTDKVDFAKQMLMRTQKMATEVNTAWSPPYTCMATYNHQKVAHCHAVAKPVPYQKAARAVTVPRRTRQNTSTAANCKHQTVLPLSNKVSKGQPTPADAAHAAITNIAIGTQGASFGKPMVDALSGPQSVEPWDCARR